MKRSSSLLPLFLAALFISPGAFAGDAWDSTLKEKIKAGEDRQRAYEERKRAIEEQERAKRYEEIESKGWPYEIERSVKKREITLGMTTDQVLLSWGPPQRRNRSVFQFGVHEQWIYGDRYHLFFENDVVTSWHENR